jgi:hypothetical protein
MIIPLNTKTVTYIYTRNSTLQIGAFIDRYRAAIYVFFSFCVGKSQVLANVDLMFLDKERRQK